MLARRVLLWTTARCSESVEPRAGLRTLADGDPGPKLAAPVVPDAVWILAYGLLSRRAMAAEPSVAVFRLVVICEILAASPFAIDCRR